MNRSNKLIAILATAILAVCGVIPGANAYDGWSPASGKSKVELIRYQGWRILVKQVTYANPGGCSATNGYMKIDDSNTDWMNQLSAAILSAHLSGREVAFVLDGCSGSYPIITEVLLEE